MGDRGSWAAWTSGDPDLVGPPELDVWARFVGAPDDPAVDQALLAFSTETFLIGTAMRPHEGVGQSQAHVTLSTGVLTHTITYHEPCRAAEWHLLQMWASYTGHGRSFGRGDIFDLEGRMVGSFVQDAMIRARSGGRRQALGGRAGRSARQLATANQSSLQCSASCTAAAPGTSR